MRILLFIAFSLAIVGMMSIVFVVAWLLKMSAPKEHTSKSEEPETLTIPKGYKRWVPDDEEERRMRE